MLPITSSPVTWVFIALVLIGVVGVFVAILGEAEKARSRDPHERSFRFRSR